MTRPADPPPTHGQRLLSEHCQFAVIDHSRPLIWIAPPPHPQLSIGGTHLWHFSLDAIDAQTLALFHSTLEPAECARAERLHRETDRRRFIASHGLLRQTLARYIDCQPQAIRFATGAFGKPAVLDFAGAASFHFNLSHSRDVALLALCNDREVGVDIEHEDNARDILTISNRYFSESEQAEVQNAAPTDRGRIFLEIWTRKEAILKARGVGLRGLDCLTTTSGTHDATVRTIEMSTGAIAAIAWRPPAL